MKAYRYEERIELSALTLVDLPDPTPGPREIVIRLRAVALNYRDLAIARGRYHVGVSAPLIPLADGAGEVVSVGGQVTRFAVGDLACPIYMPDWIDGPVNARVARRRLGGPSDGVLREYLCLSEEEAVRAPAGLAAEEAATLPVAAVTAWHSLYELGRVRPGDTVLVQGTGGVSIAAMQLALAGGARVIAHTRRQQAAAALRDLGVHHVLVGAGQREQRRAWSGARADVVVNVAGGASLNDSIQATRPEGWVHLVGYASGIETSFDMYTAIRHAITLRAASAGPRLSFENLNRAIEQHRLRPVVARDYPVGRIRQAYDALAQGGHVGKIVLTF